MNQRKPKTRSEAAAPAATKHLDEEQKEALDLAADAEHAVGKLREEFARKIEKLSGATQTPGRSTPE
jgi:hypothetical protein